MAPLALIAGYARSAVVPHGGAFRHLAPHELAAPVLQGLLARAGVKADQVDAVILGNALGAGGNPARMVALAAGLPERCAAYSVDTQCCSGLDSIALGAALIASGQAGVVVAGGVEAWSRAPMRLARPRHPGEMPRPYERPAFSPVEQDDPDLLLAAARYAADHAHTREQQDFWALHSHERAVHAQARLAAEIVAVDGVAHDAYPRLLNPARLGRMPVAAQSDRHDAERARMCSVSTLAVSTRADGAGLVLMASASACAALGLSPVAEWHAHCAMNGSSAMPLVQALAAADRLVRDRGLRWRELACVEMHDAFAVQGLQWERHMVDSGADVGTLNRYGGGVARGHPIGASAAIALVRLLADLRQDHARGAWGLGAVAGAGGLGSAALLRQC